MKATTKRFSGGLLLFLVFACSTHASAQTANATLSGTVSDSARALIPGVGITAVHTQTGVVTAVEAQKDVTRPFFVFVCSVLCLCVPSPIPKR